MSTWKTYDMAAALPEVNDNPNADQTPAPAGPNPQEHGWVKPQAYDYADLMKTTKEHADARALFESQAAENTQNKLAQPDWAGNAAVYEWKDEYGDVGPRFEDIEQQLFGSENHVRSGIRFDKINEIKVLQEGIIRLEPVRKFEDAGLHPVILETVKLAGYIVPTPIQSLCLPAIFKGYDVVACAQTGSGKTAAFLIPILSKLMGKAKKLAAQRPNPALYNPATMGPIRAEPLVLIVCPSRELATQIFDEARRFCYRTMFRPAVVYGGGPLSEQILQIGKGADILIGTPGRLVDLISRPHLLTLRRLKYMVLDEADELLNSDWDTEMQTIMSGGDQEVGNITYMMFSATFPKGARDLAKEHLKHDHVRIRVGRAGSSHSNIVQDVVFVEPHSKYAALFDVLMNQQPDRTIIFVNSKRTADEVDDYLFNRGMPCTSIHSGRTQKEREDAIRGLRSGKTPILIATGVSARGLDINGIHHVINFDLPSSQYGGIEEYTHRIGRTGRIGNTGKATSFYNERDSDLAETLVKTLLETKQKVPDFLAGLIPEGFDNEGGGDVTKLHFEADSDDENAEQEADGNQTGGDGWSAAPAEEAAAPAWGASETQVAPQAQAPATENTWGQPPAAVNAAQWGPPPPPVNQAEVPAPATQWVQATAPPPTTWGASPAPVVQPQAPAGHAQAAAPVSQWSNATPAAGPPPGWNAPPSQAQFGHPANPFGAPTGHGQPQNVAAPANQFGGPPQVAPQARAPVVQAPIAQAPPAAQGWDTTGGGWGAEPSPNTAVW